jgi:hypothetical protein
LIWSNDEQLDGALMASAQHRNVRGPCEAFALGARQLHFHDHTHYWSITDEQNYGVGAELRWHDLGQVRRSDSWSSDGIARKIARASWDSVWKRSEL